MKLDKVDAIANAVLYEGFVLYPYRPSSKKNRVRWTFGGIHPRDYSVATGGSEPATMQTQVLLLDRGDARVEVRVRFLHLIQHFPHLLRQDARREWLLKKGDFRLQYPVPDDRIIGVAAQEEDLDAGLRLGQPLGHQPTAHTRHHHIRQEQVNSALVLLGHPQGCLAVPRLQHGIALHLEGIPGE